MVVTVVVFQRLILPGWVSVLSLISALLQDPCVELLPEPLCLKEGFSQLSRDQFLTDAQHCADMEWVQCLLNHCLFPKKWILCTGWGWDWLCPHLFMPQIIKLESNGHPGRKWGCKYQQWKLSWTAKSLLGPFNVWKINLPYFAVTCDMMAYVRKILGWNPGLAETKRSQ